MSNIISFIIVAVMIPVTIILLYLNKYKKELWDEWKERMIKKGRK